MNLFPIYRTELKKFLPLAFILFGILFNYTILRDVKDVLIVHNIGPHVVPFVQSIAGSISAFLFVLAYMKIASHFNQEKIFYVLSLSFLTYFVLFALVLFPYVDVLHPLPSTVAWYKQEFPSLSGVIDMCATWVYVTFYVMAELWGSAMVSLGFWQFANHIVPLEQSKRFYALLVVVGNVSLICSGLFIRMLTGTMDHLFDSMHHAWQYSLYGLMGMVVILGILVMILYRWMHLHVLNDPRHFTPAVRDQGDGCTKEKPKLSMMESFQMMVRSKELMAIVVMMFGYAITTNFIELQWQHQLELYFKGDHIRLSQFMGMYSSLTGVFTLLLGVLTSTVLMRFFSWSFVASLTPIVMIFGGGGFLMMVCAVNGWPHWFDSVRESITAVGVYGGMAVLILAKAMKYTLFDPTKEMAYIPLDDELKSKGKAAVDVIGGRVGKSIGSYMQMMMLLMVFPKGVMAISSFALVMFVVIVVGWVWAVRVLAKEMNALGERG